MVIHRCLLNLSLIIFLGGVCSIHIRIPEVGSGAVENVLSRLPVWVSNEFSEIIITNDGHKLESGSARLVGTPNGLKVEAASPVDALFAIHSYIREYCGASVTWAGSNLPKHASCDRPDIFEKEYSAPKIRYFGNPITYSISLPFADWNQWEELIDWLALNGFNMVLTPVGQEALWRQVWIDQGLSPKAVDYFFTGPAFSAWNRLGHIQHLGGPVSKDYFDSQLELNKKIVGRMNELGIVPVLPTFAGFVPDEFVRVNSGLQFIKRCKGFNVSCVSSLHPEEPAFHKIANAFMEAQDKVYGKHATRVFSADPANFSTRKANEIVSVGKAILNGCGPNCTWMVQSTTFADWQSDEIEALMSSVPKGRMIVLDMKAERRQVHRETADFYGHAFVWCMEHNKGGNAQMRGHLGKIQEEFIGSATMSKSMIGAGLTMEGIDQNYIVYQYFIDLIWATDEIDPFYWIEKYVYSRYGKKDKSAVDAWRRIIATYYTHIDDQSAFAIYHRPNISTDMGEEHFEFQPSHMGHVKNIFEKLNHTYGHNALFRQDFGDIRREFVQRQIIYANMNSLYRGLTESSYFLRQACDELEKKFEELDLVARHDLSVFILQARSAAIPASAADDFERMTRYQLTLFAPNGQMDYAAKEWSGLIRKYYAKRWSHFCDIMVAMEKRQRESIVFTDSHLPKEIMDELHRKVEIPFVKIH